MCPVLWHLCFQPCLDVRDCGHLVWQHEVHEGTEKVLFPDQNAQCKALQSPWRVLFPPVLKQKFSFYHRQKNTPDYHMAKITVS